MPRTHIYLLLITILAGLILVIGPATARADDIQIDSLVIKDFMGNTLSGSVAVFEPILATLTFTVADDNDDGILEIDSVEYTLPVKVIVRIRGLGQVYEQVYRRTAGTHTVNATFLPRARWCDAYEIANPEVDPAVANLKGIVVGKQDGTTFYKGKVISAVNVECN